MTWCSACCCLTFFFFAVVPFSLFYSFTCNAECHSFCSIYIWHVIADVRLLVLLYCYTVFLTFINTWIFSSFEWPYIVYYLKWFFFCNGVGSSVNWKQPYKAMNERKTTKTTTTTNAKQKLSSVTTVRIEPFICITTNLVFKSQKHLKYSRFFTFCFSRLTGTYKNPLSTFDPELLF